MWAVPEQTNRLKKELREITMIHEAYEEKRNRWNYELMKSQQHVNQDLIRQFEADENNMLVKTFS